ncbi:hypothetical protein DL96DRAFT_1620653 [Flagelloscypha sp. PMI_526]|nr:hypothetical protein DL96DRAFT_1620653 [Flagelloscypha sp. PMI_526]
MSTPIAGTVQEPSLDSSDTSPSRGLFSKMMAATYKNLPFYIVSSFIFLSCTVSGRFIFMTYGKRYLADDGSKPPGATGEFISAILAGILFWASCLALLELNDSGKYHQSRSKFVRAVSNPGNPLLLTITNVIIGAPIYLLLSGLILKLLFIFPDLDLVRLVHQSIIGLCSNIFVLIGLFIWWVKRKRTSS